jgi:DNA-binding transcriptional LysR family regulator
MPPNNYALFRRLNAFVERRVLAEADVVAFTNDETRAAYAERYATGSKGMVVPHLADVASLHADSEPAGSVEGDGDDIRLAYIGAFHRGIREPHVLLEWARRLHERSARPIALDIFGPANGFDVALQSQGCVQYHGMVSRERATELARAAAVPVKKLQGRPLISLPGPAEDPANSVVASLLRRHQISMPVANRVETAHSALSLVLAGEGMAILPACAQLGCPTGVVFRPFLDADDAMDVAVCWRRDSLNPLVRNFLKCAEKVIRDA